MAKKLRSLPVLNSTIGHAYQEGDEAPEEDNTEFGDLKNGVRAITGTDMKLIKLEAERLLEAEILFVEQKAKCSFLKHGDRYTKFFHNLIKRNKRKNAILAIQDSLGNIVSDDKEIVNEFVGHFKEMLGTCVERTPLNLDIIQDGPIVLHEQWPSLISKVSMDEVQIALFDIDSEKSPGLDGFGSFSLKLYGPLFHLTFFIQCRNSFPVKNCSYNGIMQPLR